MSSVFLIRLNARNAFWYLPFFMSQRGLSGQSQIKKRSGTAGANAAANWKRHASRPMFIKIKLLLNPTRIPKATKSWKLVTRAPLIAAGETSALYTGIVEILMPMPMPMTSRQIVKSTQFLANPCARTGNTTNRFVAKMVPRRPRSWLTGSAAKALPIPHSTGAALIIPTSQCLWAMSNS